MAVGGALSTCTMYTSPSSTYGRFIIAFFSISPGLTLVHSDRSQPPPSLGWSS